MVDFAEVRQRIERAYPSLSPKLKRVARFALDTPTEIALRPLRAIAERVGVGPTTLIRLARQLDFVSYDDFRDAFREQVRQAGGLYAGRAERLQSASQGDAAPVLAEVEASLRRNLDHTVEMLRTADLHAAAGTLLAARRNFLLGMRSAHAAAFYGHYLGKLILPRMRLIEARAGMLVDEIADCGPEDAMIAISFQPYPRDTVVACRHFTASGGALIAITDSPLSPIAQGARHLFLAPTASPSFYISFVPTFIVLEALFAVVAAEGGEGVIGTLRRNDELRDTFGVYWEEGR